MTNSYDWVKLWKLEAELSGVHLGTHVILPVEPTYEMIEEGRGVFIDKPGDIDVFNAYKAMIKAAQEKAND
jgi:hypothetical protein